MIKNDISPPDEHNRTLLSNVRPAGRSNPEPAVRYNLVVVGAGTAGLVTAAGAAGLGAKVALVERHLMGGDCLNVGCVPSKSLIRSARAAFDVRDSARFGITVPEGVKADFPAVMERLRRVRAGISHNDSVRRFEEMGIDVFQGHGRFAGPGVLEVGGAELRFRKAVIATGARASAPPIEGLEAAGYLNNETVFNLTELPRRLAVIGAGPIGCELAQSFRRLGSDVTIIEIGSQLLSREDGDAAGIIAEAFRRDGVEVMVESSVSRVSRVGDGRRLHLTRSGREERLDVDEILVGVGRSPNLEDLGLENIGVRYDPGTGVEVDDNLRTTNPAVFAAGDICMRHKFTHAADAAARIVIQNALFPAAKGKLSALTVPWCTYTDPEIAHVGMYARDARERGMEIDTYLQPMADVDRAVAEGEGEGFVKIHVRKGTDRIVGATMVARHAGEMISEITLAMVAGVGLRKLSGVIHPYPTQAEAIKKVADSYNRTRLTPRLKRWLERWMSWSRR